MTGQGDIFDAIAEFNRAYLVLAQRMLRADYEQGKRQLGISDDIAASIVALTPHQIEAIAASGELFCEFRIENAPGRA
ncbi:flagellar transcriptional regulator FlhD [Burkholderia contaminans]|jgi:flagellar transcriptional activator FlhD|uniref:Flagellar transcriptional regulator FlhD n=3 Tax=Burkholderia contaminans TaxID=488447 RepID=A0A1E3FKN0_9BURK|nr:flagellar transcriptional regulator FlhD [Burkholderia contaminans]KKL42100.1 flagellar transcriptional regulator FlhD [Burkholderia contaminans LMG 23361]UTP27460.1 flagellar transcriptional regulator FlhD [Burkholderia sp. FXe9]MBA9829961.1 flagellar transcriptional regulator FlhD [Burkholderia contaminans]MBA9837039.1 flagellar transcriptional regulator FlhD [Burkholderia contaminans]MBA9861669.1 flagellar transcriptional regulator FlhD [Burkholderia contaminans]